MLESFLNESLAEMDAAGLRRRMRDITGPQDRIVFIDGKPYRNFSSNNYLGLANDGRLKEAGIAAIQGEGVGAGASRLVCGNLSAHRQLEQEFARAKKTPRALVFNTGYMANVGIITSLFGKGDIIFSDRLNHASIVDGILLSGATWRRYPHVDMTALAEMLAGADGHKKKVIITDSVFSMDGDIAPLPDIVGVAQKYDCAVMIDEAHAFGVLGETGAGAAEHFHLEDKIDIQMGTLSKAAGCLGAYCCGSESLIEFLLNKARSFIYTTALPPAIAASARRAVAIIQEEPGRRERLWENTRYFVGRLKEMGFNTLNTQTPIIPVVVGDSQQAIEFSQRLQAQGILIVAIRPPTVPPQTARLRISLMATHTQDDMDEALAAVEKIGKELCLI